MDIAITGTVKQILDEQSGTSRNGPWRKQEFILETEDRYPKPVCIVQWGDDIDEFGLREGERITAHVDIQSREYNGRWYTDVKAWRVARDEAGAGQAGAGQAGGGRAGQGQGGPGAPPTADDEPWPDGSSFGGEASDDDDLPF